LAKLTYGWDDHHLNYVTKLRKKKQKKGGKKTIENIQAFFLITISLLVWKMSNERERMWGE
jgi:hypothetical protein